MMAWKGYREEAKRLLLVWLSVGLLLAAGSCLQAYRDTAPEPEHATDWAMGGPGWRVVDVQETTDSAGLAAIHEVAEEVAECLGRSIDLRGWRFFGTNGISYRTPHPSGGWTWQRAMGVTLYNEKWVYVQTEHRRRSADHVVGTLKHELVHVGMPKLDHPSADRLIGKCAGLHAGQERYRRVYLRSQP